MTRNVMAQRLVRAALGGWVALAVLRVTWCGSKQPAGEPEQGPGRPNLEAACKCYPLPALRERGELLRRSRHGNLLPHPRAGFFGPDPLAMHAPVRSNER